MSYKEVSLGRILGKQVQFKLHAYSGVFFSLVIVQLIGFLFSFNGSGMSGGGNSQFRYEIQYISGDVIVFFTMMWAFITAILTTTKAYRYDDFVFITNRMTSNLSNIIFLFISSLIASILAFLTSFVMKVVVYFSASTEYMLLLDSVTIKQIVFGIIGTCLYLFLLMGIGYFIGVLVQVHKSFILWISVLVIAALFYQEQSGRSDTFIGDVVTQFTMEANLFVFAIKVVLTTSLLFGGAMFITNRMEVGR